MGIKGIYGEIGPGQRISLAKLAIQNLEEKGRPLRIAVDISIWQFQIQSGRGGSNPALRTFFYRLLRLLSLGIQPLFVFDGPHKPPFKRNKRTAVNSSSIADLSTKSLLKLFECPFHVAPGEAEAECAFLQREGIVDAVLSEDVDTLMFGCGTTLRNWSSEESRSNHAPTHVSLYDAKATRDGKSGLDREGMILVALMSGGDYITAGIPGCGIKTACEAARAGFGKSLCRLSRKDAAGVEKWRDDLANEIKTNDHKYFRTKHKSLEIPDDFPNLEVLGYYTHPVVSSATKLIKLREEVNWEGEITIPELRQFVAENFDWTNTTGAKKLIRTLAPALLVSKLQSRGSRRGCGIDGSVFTGLDEKELVKAICGKRNHFSTDGMPELRLIYHPANLVGLNFDAEVEETEEDADEYGRDGLAPIAEDGNVRKYYSEDEANDARTRSTSPRKRAASKYDPNEPDKLWVAETIVKLGMPLMVEDYEEAQRNPKKFINAKSATKKATSKGGMPKGALEPFLTIIKPTVDSRNPLISKTPQKSTSALLSLPPVYLIPTLERFPVIQAALPLVSDLSEMALTKMDISKQKSKSKYTRKDPKVQSPSGRNNRPRNPWTVARPSSVSDARPTYSRIHSSKPGICNQDSFIKNNDPRKTITPSGVTQHREPSPCSSPPIFKAPSRYHDNDEANSAIKRDVIDISSSPCLISKSSSSKRNEIKIKQVDTTEGSAEVELGEKEKRKRLIILRESLEGSWKEVSSEEWKPAKERGRSRAWRISAVEVMDMTKS